MILCIIGRFWIDFLILKDQKYYLVQNAGFSWAVYWWVWPRVSITKRWVLYFDVNSMLLCQDQVNTASWMSMLLSLLRYGFVLVHNRNRMLDGTLVVIQICSITMRMLHVVIYHVMLVSARICKAPTWVFPLNCSLI